MSNPPTPEASELFPIRADEKGPKTIAILLIFGATLMLATGFGDVKNSFAEDFPEEDLDGILENYQRQEVNITAEDYQLYHDEIREDGAYSVRGFSLMSGGILVLIGGFALFKLKSIGVKLSIAGSAIGLIGGFSGSWMMASTSSEYLPDEVTMINEYLSYACVAFMGICLAMAILPLINASARLALDQRVTFVTEEE